jgi:protein-disulfide isomerase
MTTRRTFLAAAGTTAAAGLAGCAELGGGGGGSDGGDGGGPDGPVATAPVPDDPGSYTYARMGTGADATVTYVGNWKCPVCAEFSTGSDRVYSFSRLVEDYVAPGRVDLEYRALCYTGDGEPFLGPDAPRAGRAGLAVWSVDPEQYWAYHERVMANQPPEARQWATRSRLVEFARSAGVSDPDAVGSAVADGAYASEVEATTSFAAEVGVSGTPSLIIGNDVYSPFEPEPLRNALDTVSG